jgi:hypothetical protein
MIFQMRKNNINLIFRKTNYEIAASTLNRRNGDLLSEF